jgi:Barstar (barnase inhibitor)
VTSSSSPAADDVGRRVDAVLDGRTAPGVRWVTSSTVVAGLAQRAESRGAVVWIVDHPSHTKHEVMDAFAAGCSLPVWFGRNYDALADSLTDLDPGANGGVLVWSTAGQFRAALPAQWPTMRAILERAVRFHADAGARFNVICAGSSLPGIDPL